jgi:zinc protease
LIRERFSRLRNPEQAPPRRAFAVPDHRETLFSIATDPELQSTRVEIVYKRDRDIFRTERDYRRLVVENLYTSILNFRLQERAQQSNPPYLAAQIGKSSGTRTKDIVIQVALVKEGQYEDGLCAHLVDARRATAYGFTAA